MSLSPNIRKHLKKRISESSEELFDLVVQGDRSAISKAITLIESSQKADFESANELLKRCVSKKTHSKRIGITGVPGVGKSTFIEAFGLDLIEKGYKVAVLAVDPTSQISRGSILGDKTRMNELANHPKAFVRPSPTSGTLGGVGRKTRETIPVLEAAGFDIILVETVGVGQSEVDVYNMTDFFLLLMLAGAGDDLQGVKRGIMEMADMIFINKSEAPNDKLAKRARTHLIQALHLFPPKENQWETQVVCGSALTLMNMEKTLQQIEAFFSKYEASGFINDQRKKQRIQWFEKALGDLLQSELKERDQWKPQIEAAKKAVSENVESPYRAASQLIEQLLKKTS